MPDLLQDLNEAQKEVVTTTDGPILVLAGAGSGKTKALTHRIAYLITEKNIPAENILAITFTNKAAGEMKSRVESLIRKGVETQNLPVMGTFHSICAKILRKEAHHLGYPHSFVIFDDQDSSALVKQIIKKMDLESTKISPQSIKSKISGAKNEMIGPEKYQEIAGGYNGEQIAEIYKEYQKQLAQNDAFDFDDLLLSVVKIFEKVPEVLEKYQKIWKYVLIDEYQDTNRPQYLFAKYLTAKSHNLCVVGDDWQSIYSWRGANFRNILNFKKDWPEAKVIKLEQNYRSTKAIISAAQAVIEKNQERSEKVLWTENETGTGVNIFEASNEEEESSFVAKEALRLSGQGKRFSRMAVFYRTNAQSRVLEEQLLRYRIPYQIIGGVRFYERKEIKDVLSWLRIASGANDWISFERSLSNPPSGIGKTSLSRLKNHAESEKLKINELTEEVISGLVPAKAAIALKKYFVHVSKIAEAGENSVSAAIETAISYSGIREYLSDGSYQNEERLENLKEMFSVAAEYEKLKGKMSLSEFLEEVALISDIDNYQENKEGITLMTLHTSKGLEFDTVFIIGLEENIFPHSRSLFEPQELEEERRLFYVGLTRTMKSCYLLYARSRLYFGTIQTNQPSRFLTEIPESLINYVNQSTTGAPKEVIEERIPGAIQTGDRVEHESFGKGEVVRVNEDELTVIFDDSGEKVISLYYAPIKKL